MKELQVVPDMASRRRVPQLHKVDPLLEISHLLLWLCLRQQLFKAHQTTCSADVEHHSRVVAAFHALVEHAHLDESAVVDVV